MRQSHITNPCGIQQEFPSKGPPSCKHMRFCGHIGTLLTYFVDLFLFASVFDILPCLCLAVLWSPAGKGLTSMHFCTWHFLVLLSLFYKVSCVRCGTWLYRFLIFAFFLTFNSHEYRLARNTVNSAILSDQMVFGRLLGVPISYYRLVHYFA